MFDSNDFKWISKDFNGFQWISIFLNGKTDKFVVYDTDKILENDFKDIENSEIQYLLDQDDPDQSVNYSFPKGTCYCILPKTGTHF